MQLWRVRGLVNGLDHWAQLKKNWNAQTAEKQKDLLDNFFCDDFPTYVWDTTMLFSGIIIIDMRTDINWDRPTKCTSWTSIKFWHSKFHYAETSSFLMIFFLFTQAWWCDAHQVGVHDDATENRTCNILHLQHFIFSIFTPSAAGCGCIIDQVPVRRDYFDFEFLRVRSQGTWRYKDTRPGEYPFTRQILDRLCSSWFQNRWHRMVTLLSAANTWITRPRQWLQILKSDLIHQFNRRLTAARKSSTERCLKVSVLILAMVWSTGNTSRSTIML